MRHGDDRHHRSGGADRDAPRALRFYEARGLVRPLRTAGGRRIFGAGDLARLHAIAALKRAGFTLAAIARLLARREVDLGRLVTAQFEALDAHADRIAGARTMPVVVQSVGAAINRA